MHCVRSIVIDPNGLDTGKHSITIKVKTGPCQFELPLDVKLFSQSVKSIIDAHTRIHDPLVLKLIEVYSDFY